MFKQLLCFVYILSSKLYLKRHYVAKETIILVCRWHSYQQTNKQLINPCIDYVLRSENVLANPVFLLYLSAGGKERTWPPRKSPISWPCWTLLWMQTCMASSCQVKEHTFCRLCWCEDLFVKPFAKSSYGSSSFTSRPQQTTHPSRSRRQGWDGHTDAKRWTTAGLQRDLPPHQQISAFLRLAAFY